MTLGLRTRLLSAAAAPPLTLAAVAAGGTPGWLVAALAALLAGLAALVVVALLSPFRELQADAAQALRNADLAAAAEAGDGTGAVGHAVAALAAELALTRAALAERDAQFRGTLAEAAAALKALARSWRVASPLRPASPWVADNDALADALARSPPRGPRSSGARPASRRC